MVIGDSLAQGCRSLSVASHLCEQSYSAILAREQGWSFNVPAFPRPVLFDLEDVVRKYLNWGIIGGWVFLFNRLQAGFDEWVQHFLSPASVGTEWCDNLAISGATLEEMGADRNRARHFSWTRSRGVIEKHRGSSIRELIFEKKDAIGELHLAINAGFVLNPHGLRKYADWTMLDWVDARRPKRLLVHMGHNNGLYPIGSNAEFVDLEEKTLPAYKRMIDEIMAVTKVTQQVIFLLLPKVSAVANLEIVGDGRDDHGYGPRYRPVFSTSLNEFTGAQMRAVDEMIKKVNRALRDHIRQYDGSHWVEVVEAYEILEANDYKQTLDRSRQTYVPPYAINNRYLKGSGKTLLSGGRMRGSPSGVKWAFDDGGFQSIDGMHPTALGYCEMAIELGKRLNWKYNKEKVRKTALANEKLITAYPAGHQSVVSAMKFLRGRPKNGVSHEPVIDEANKDGNVVHMALSAQRACARC